MAGLARPFAFVRHAIVLDRRLTTSTRRASSAGARVIRCARGRSSCSRRCCRASRSISTRLRRTISPRCFRVPVDDVRLEIGFGGAEHLIAQAQAHPRIGFIGCEPFVNGMAKALVAIDESEAREHPPASWRRRRSARLAAGGLARARRPALSRSVAEAAPLEAPLRDRRATSRGSRASCGPAANSASRATGRTTPSGRWRVLRVRRDFVWTAERADDWRKPWPGFAGTRYEAKAIARRAHALLSDLPRV